MRKANTTIVMYEGESNENLKYLYINFIALLRFSLDFPSYVRLSSWNNSAPTGQIFMKFDIWGIFEHLSIKFMIHLNKYDKNNRYSTWRPMYIYGISLNYSYREEHFRQKLKGKSKHAFYVQCTRLFEMIVGVLSTCHTHFIWDRSICTFLFNRITLPVFVTYFTGALYVYTLWFYKHQHDNEM